MVKAVAKIGGAQAPGLRDDATQPYATLLDTARDFIEGFAVALNAEGGINRFFTEARIQAPAYIFDVPPAEAGALLFHDGTRQDPAEELLHVPAVRLPA